MSDDTTQDRIQAHLRDLRQQEVAHKAIRQEFLEKLLGGKNQLAWQAPLPLEDFDDLLCQHAAQLSNAVRYTMEHVLSDDAEIPEQAQAVGALTRMIQTNIAIAKALSPLRAKSKTVRGGSNGKGPQD